MAEAARILLVEDSDTQAVELRHVLAREGYSVHRHVTAESALESLNQSVPDLIVSDYHLPGMNGDELARQVRINGRTRGVPIVMLTHSAGPETERQGLESGADAYVPKARSQDALIPRIRALLRLRGTATPAADAGASTFRRARVLILHHSPTFRAFLAGQLVQDGYAVEAADADAAGLARAEAGAPALAEWDCILVDLDAPGFDGVEACRALDRRREGEATAAPIVGIALAAEMDLVGRGLAAGADDVVARATETDLLKLRVRTLIRRKLLREDNRRSEDEHRRNRMALALAEGKAALAEALAHSNGELADANRKLRETHTQLVQAAKMASLGELVAGIAHELNNPLSFLLAHQRTVARLLAELPADEGGKLAKARDRLAAMAEGLVRVEELVVKLKRFSRLDEGELQTIDVPESLDAVLALLGHKLGPGIRVRRSYAGSPTLFCSAALLNQVVMNIVSNAADALGGDGVITIATRDEPGEYVIEISDTGPGIPAEVRSRIFEPFFTTKPVGEGTGLGLAIAYGIVRAHDGTIEAGDAEGGGARFTIRIPVRTGAAAAHG